MKRAAVTTLVLNLALVATADAAKAPAATKAPAAAKAPAVAKVTSKNPWITPALAKQRQAASAQALKDMSRSSNPWAANPFVAATNASMSFWLNTPAAKMATNASSMWLSASPLGYGSRFGLAAFSPFY